MTRYTYQHLVEFVDGDHELIAHLVEEGIIEYADDGVVPVDPDMVVLARTLWRELEVDWSGIAIICRLTAQLATARRRIAELEGKRG